MVEETIKAIKETENEADEIIRKADATCTEILEKAAREACRCGGTGRHKGLKIPRGRLRTSSSLVSGTKRPIFPWGTIGLFLCFQSRCMGGWQHAVF